MKPEEADGRTQPPASCITVRCIMFRCIGSRALELEDRPWCQRLCGRRTTRSPGEPDGVEAVAFRSALRATVAASAAPYGYTLTIWTTGAVLTHARGIPSTAEALLLLVGAVGGYALVGVVAFGGLSEHFSPQPSRAAIWGALHVFSVGLAITGAMLVAHTVHHTAAWPIDGFVTTSLYLLGSAGELMVAHATLSRRPGRA